MKAKAFFRQANPELEYSFEVSVVFSTPESTTRTAMLDGQDMVIVIYDHDGEIFINDRIGYLRG